MRTLLFEFEDQSWFPAVLRDYQTEYLGFMAHLTGMYSGVPATIDHPGALHLVDLASGSGAPAILATEALRRAGGRLTLTDKFPPAGADVLVASAPNVHYQPQPLDIVAHPLPPADVYTLFNAFHHFTQAEQWLIIEKAATSNRPLHVFEPLQRDVLTFVKVLIATTLGLLLFAPFIRPWRWSRLLFTYLIPVGIAVTLWDGLVSVLRALSPQECRALQIKAAKANISLTIRQHSGTFANLTHLSTP